jgi:hypothetical protein
MRAHAKLLEQQVNLFLVEPEEEPEFIPSLCVYLYSGLKKKA